MRHSDGSDRASCILVIRPMIHLISPFSSIISSRYNIRLLILSYYPSSIKGFSLCFNSVASLIPYDSQCISSSSMYINDLNAFNLLLPSKYFYQKKKDKTSSSVMSGVDRSIDAQTLCIYLVILVSCILSSKSYRTGMPIESLVVMSLRSVLSMLVIASIIYCLMSVVNRSVGMLYSIPIPFWFKPTSQIYCSYMENISLGLSQATPAFYSMLASSCSSVQCYELVDELSDPCDYDRVGYIGCCYSVVLSSC